MRADRRTVARMERERNAGMQFPDFAVAHPGFDDMTGAAY